jgi:hypothetical protein
MPPAVTLKEVAHGWDGRQALQQTDAHAYPFIMETWLKVNLLAVGALVALGSSSAHAVPTLSNGSFETPVISGFSNVSNSNPNLYWAGSTGSVDMYQGNQGFLGNLPAYQGNQFAEVQQSGINDTISQTVTGFSGGSFVTFSFAQAARSGTGQNTLNFKILETGTSNTLFSQNYTSDTSDTPKWTLRQGTSLRTTATSVDFIFTGVSTSLYPVGCPGVGSCSQPGNGNFIDAVTAGESVPGPLPLMGAATAFAYSRRIRRRIKKAQS